jgi:hypothetical protein
MNNVMQVLYDLNNVKKKKKRKKGEKKQQQDTLKYSHLLPHWTGELCVLFLALYFLYIDIF